MSYRFSDTGRVIDDSPVDGAPGEEHYRGGSRQMRGSRPPVTQPGTTHSSLQRRPHPDLFDRRPSVANATTRSASASRRAQDAPHRERSDRGWSFQSQDYLPQVGTQFSPEIEYPAVFSVSGSPPAQSSERTRREDRDHVERREHDRRPARSEFFEGHRLTEQYNYAADGRPLRNRHIEPEHYRPLPREGGHRTHRGEPQVPQGQQRQPVLRQEQRRVAPQERRQHPDDRERQARRPRRRDHDSDSDSNESQHCHSRRRHHH